MALDSGILPEGRAVVGLMIKAPRSPRTSHPSSPRDCSDMPIRLAQEGTMGSVGPGRRSLAPKRQKAGARRLRPYHYL
jgi:hypothetical protein